MTKDEALKMAIVAMEITDEAFTEFSKGLVGLGIPASILKLDKQSRLIPAIQACKEALAENETSSLEIVGFIEGSNLSTNEPDFVGFLYKTQRYGQTPVYKLVNTFEESANG